MVLGIGHPFRGDDAVGPLVAERVAALALPGVVAVAHHGEGTDLMRMWQGYDRVVLVDATCSGQPPGLVRVWDDAGEVPAVGFPKSSHLFGVAEALEMARLLQRLPPLLRVVGIEGAEFSIGAEMSGPVVASLPTAVQAVSAFLRLSGPQKI